MRVLIVIVLAIIAVGAAGVWALGEYGHLLTNEQAEGRAPLVREPELVAANDTAPAMAAPNQATTLQSAPTPEAANPAPADEPAKEALAAEPPPPPAPDVAPPEAAADKDQVAMNAAPRSAESFDAARARSAAAASEATPAPPPPPADPVVSTASAPPAAAPAAASAAGASSSLTAEFKSRKVTYNRPPEKLALNKPIDISLIIDSTGQNQAAETLKDLPGTIVERDVDLSDFVSAELKGADFDIQLQTAAVRQKLSSKIANEWRWRVTPTATGTRTLTLTIYGYASGSLDAEPLDAYRDEITVEVQQLDQIINWAKGVQPVFAVLAALAGAASALFAFLRFREEKKKNRAA